MSHRCTSARRSPFDYYKCRSKSAAVFFFFPWKVRKDAGCTCSLLNTKNNYFYKAGISTNTGVVGKSAKRSDLHLAPDATQPGTALQVSRSPCAHGVPRCSSPAAAMKRSKPGSGMLKLGLTAPTPLRYSDNHPVK